MLEERKDDAKKLHISLQPINSSNPMTHKVLEYHSWLLRSITCNYVMSTEISNPSSLITSIDPIPMVFTTTEDNITHPAVKYLLTERFLKQPATPTAILLFTQQALSKN